MIQFMAEAEGALPSNAQYAWLSGDDTKFDEALANGLDGMTEKEVEGLLSCVGPLAIDCKYKSHISSIY